MFGDDEEDISSGNATRFPVLPSLVSLQQMNNRLHLAFLGKKLMKWTAISTGKELRRLANNIDETYKSFADDLRDAFILLARARYFYPDLNKMALSDPQKTASVTVTSYIKAMAGVKVMQYTIIEDKKPYVHMGISEGGQSIQEAKDAWLELLKRMIAMTQLRVNFTQVDRVHKNANKKQNVLSKVTIPRILATIKYILTELEEQAREETFRMKRIKQKKNKENENKKDKSASISYHLKNDEDKDDKNDDDDKDKKDGKIVKYSSLTTIIKLDDKEDKKENISKEDNKTDENIEKKAEENDVENNGQVLNSSSYVTNIEEDLKEKMAKLSNKPANAKSESTCELIPCSNHEKEIKVLMSVIANAMKCTEFARLENLMTISLDKLLDTCNEIKNKLENYTNTSVCLTCKKNMLDNIVTMNIEPFKRPSQIRTTISALSASNSVKPACGLVPSPTSSVKSSSGQEVNLSGAIKYHMCTINLENDNTKMNVESLKIPSQTRTTDSVPSMSDSIKLGCQVTCGLESSLTPSIKPSCLESNKSDTGKYQKCTMNLEDHDTVMNEEPLKIPSQARTTISTLSASDFIKLSCRVTGGELAHFPTTFIKSSSCLESNKSDTTKYHMCTMNLEDDNTVINEEPLKIPSQIHTVNPAMPSIYNSRKSTCKDMCRLGSSPTTFIKPSSGQELNKSGSVKYHMCRINLQDEDAKNLQHEAILNISSETHIMKSMPSADDFIKPLPLSINPVCKESIREIEKPMATYEFSSENDDQLGYFEKKFKETVKVTRLQNEDGTISEEKQTITIKTERKNPRKNFDYVTSCSECGSGRGHFRDGGYSGESGRGTRNDYNYNIDSNYQSCCPRQTKSEHKHRMYTMGDPKVRSCMSAENLTTCKGALSRCGNANSCYIFTKTSKVTIGLEPQTKPNLSVPLSANSSVCCPTKIDLVCASELTPGSGNSIIISRSIGKQFRPSIQGETKSSGMEAIWRDVCTSTTDLDIIRSKITTNVRSTIAVPHNLELKHSAPDNRINDKGDIYKTKSDNCNIKLLPKKVKVSYNGNCKNSCNEVVLKGSLLDALKQVYLPHTATTFSHEAANSSQKANHKYNIYSKLLLNKMIQKPVKISKDVYPEYEIKSRESQISSSCKACSPVTQIHSGVSYPSHYSCLPREVDTNSYRTLSVSSFCAICQVSQQEFELQSSSHDKQSPNLSYVSCYSVAAETSDKIRQEYPAFCCRKGSEKQVSTEYPKKCCDIRKAFITSSDKVTKSSTEVRKKVDINKQICDQESSGQSQKQIYCKIKCSKFMNSGKLNNESQDLLEEMDTTNADKILENPSNTKIQTKDVGTCTNRSSRFDVRPAILHLSDKIRGHCGHQSDTQVLSNRFVDWLPLKPIQKCRSTCVNKDYLFKQ